MGAYLYGGRWNSPGQYVVYASGNVSLAMLEVLVHIDDAEAFAMQAHIYQRVSFDEAHLAVLDEAALPADWNARPETVETQSIGDEWVARQETPVLAVPSVVVPDELRFKQEYLNYLINPRHPDFEHAIAPREPRGLDWDPRFKLR
jgi:RES domain-containing protein